jgi:SAM-dependent methyltransferase
MTRAGDTVRLAGLVADVLACPVCGSPLDGPAGDALVCTAAGHRFPVTDGIAQLAVEAAADDWSVDAAATSAAYARQYEALDEAARYNAMYGGRATKRATTGREARLIQRHLLSQPPCRTILDLPCGGGRLSPAIAAAAPDATIVEADIGLGQVRYARDHRLPGERQVFITASGFHIPIRDGGVDAVVCVRLFHHLPAAAEQTRLLDELLRVAGRFVILTFFDFYSVKNTLRRVRAPFNRKPPKITLRPEWLRSEAHARGAEVVAMPHLFWLSSGHRYALLRKTA